MTEELLSTHAHPPTHQQVLNVDTGSSLTYTMGSVLSLRGRCSSQSGLRAHIMAVSQSASPGAGRRKLEGGPVGAHVGN